MCFLFCSSFIFKIFIIILSSLELLFCINLDSFCQFEQKSYWHFCYFFTNLNIIKNDILKHFSNFKFNMFLHLFWCLIISLKFIYLFRLTIIYLNFEAVLHILNFISHLFVVGLYIFNRFLYLLFVSITISNSKFTYLYINLDFVGTCFNGRKIMRILFLLFIFFLFFLSYCT